MKFFDRNIPKIIFYYTKKFSMTFIGEEAEKLKLFVKLALFGHFFLDFVA
jgi:hypothetical protein